MGDGIAPRVKKRVSEILEAAAEDDWASRLFDIFIISLISLNIIALILQTVQALSAEYGSLFRYFEVSSVFIFTLEYVLRLWSCTANEKFRRPILGRVRFATTPFLLVDMMAILPFYIPMLIPFDLRFLRILRVFRVFRVFKMVRYSESLRIFGSVFKAKKEELLITIFMIAMLLVIVSCLMYFAENKAQPTVFSSVPQAMLWGIGTLTTLGYEDVYPMTFLGKMLGAAVSLLGIGMFALPAGILSSGFSEEIQRRRNKA